MANIPAENDLCVCGHERKLHQLADGTLALCIKDEWCECPGFQPQTLAQMLDELEHEEQPHD